MTLKVYKVYLILERRTEQVVYVGLTRQTIYKRFLQHVARKKVNHHTHLIQLVIDGLTLQQGVVLEEMLIGQYNTRATGLNIAPMHTTGYSNYHSEEQKTKWSLERKNKPVTSEHASKNRTARLGSLNSSEHKEAISKANSKSILCLNNGKVYSSHREAAEALDLNYSKISLVVNGKRSHTKGYKFKLC